MSFAPYTKPKYEALQEGFMKPNYFWFAIKEGVADETEIPDFAGFVEVTPTGIVKFRKPPKRLHSVKLDYEQRYKFSRLLHYRYWGSIL